MVASNTSGQARNGSFSPGRHRRSFVEGSHFPIRLAAKDVAPGAGAAKLPLAAATLDVLSGVPGIADEGLGQIIAHIRAQSGTA
jgi:3-hydroxyisobutyrate dehydrogenase